MVETSATTLTISRGFKYLGIGFCFFEPGLLLVCSYFPTYEIEGAILTWQKPTDLRTSQRHEYDVVPVRREIALNIYCQNLARKTYWKVSACLYFFLPADSRFIDASLSEMVSRVKFVTFPTWDNFPTQGHLYETKKDDINCHDWTCDRGSWQLLREIWQYICRFNWSELYVQRWDCSWLSSEHALTTLIIHYRYCGISVPKGVNFLDKKARNVALIDAKETNISWYWTENTSAFSLLENVILGRVLPT